MSHKLGLEKISDIRWYFNLCLNHYGLFRLDFRKIINVWLSQLLFSTIKIEGDLSYIKLSLTRCNSDLCRPRSSSDTQCRIIRHSEQNSCYLSGGKGSQALEFTHLNRVADLKCSRSKFSCRRDIPVNRRSKQLDLRLPNYFIGASTNMRPQWILYLIL